MPIFRNSSVSPRRPLRTLSPPSTKDGMVSPKRRSRFHLFKTHESPGSSKTHSSSEEGTFVYPVPPIQHTSFHQYEFKWNVPTTLECPLEEDDGVSIMTDDLSKDDNSMKIVMMDIPVESHRTECDSLPIVVRCVSSSEMSCVSIQSLNDEEEYDEPEYVVELLQPEASLSGDDIFV